MSGALARFVLAMRRLSFVLLLGCAKQPVATSRPTAPAARPTPTIEWTEPSLQIDPVRVESRPAHELRVAIEGECPTLGLSIVGRDAFAHVTELDRVAIVHLNADPPRLIPPPPSDRRNVRDEPTPAFEWLAGRWPDRLYASYVTRGSIGMPDGLLHFDGGRWHDVPGFGRDQAIFDFVAWTPEKMLVRRLDVTGQEQLLAIGGDGAAPNMAALVRDCDDWGVTHPTIDRHGNLGVAWSCKFVDHFAIWPVGKTTPISHRLPFDHGPFSVDPDQSGGFFLSYRSGRIMHVEKRRVRLVTPPLRDAVFRDVGVDPDGSIWVVFDQHLYRRTAQRWVEDSLPGAGDVHFIAGIEHGKPWLRRGGECGVGDAAYREDGEMFARDDAGSWRYVSPPPSAFREGDAVAIDSIEADATGRLWMLAHGSPFVDGVPSNLAILTDADFGDPLRCRYDPGTMR